jgi:hypothetical protein
LEYKTGIASASSKPWVNSNGWRLQRGSEHPFFYDVTGDVTSLAMAEAFTYGREALIHTDAAGQSIFTAMLTFLESLSPGPSTPLANLAVVDEGSPESGEVMNLLTRRNFLFRIAAAPDPSLPLNVKLGTPEFPKASVANQETFIRDIRARVTDEKRILRVYGSDVVLVKAYGDAKHLRLHVINYGDQPIDGVRLRVLGSYPKISIAEFSRKSSVEDANAQDGATEFTLPELKRYAVVDLSAK